MTRGGPQAQDDLLEGQHVGEGMVKAADYSGRGCGLPAPSRAVLVDSAAPRDAGKRWRGAAVTG